MSRRSMQRLSRAALLSLSGDLTDVERRLLDVVHDRRLLSQDQLRRLFFTEHSPATNARVARRVLARLVERDLLNRLQRRIGGVRAGSAGFVYRLGPAGQRLIAFWRGEGLPRGRRPLEPGKLFVAHTLAISRVYVELVEADRRGELELLGFQSEPECWRTHSDPLGGTVHLKPDAYVRIAQGAYEDRWFVEMDLGSEGSGTLTRKLQAYCEYWRSGQEQAEAGVFPRVVWLAADERRRALLIDICSRLPAETWQLFAVIAPDQLLRLAASTVPDEAWSIGAIS
jgi:hypothetical protein